MEFDLKKTLLALLFSSSEPLSSRDVQAVIARYHAQLADAMEDAQSEVATDTDGQGVMRAVLEQVPTLLTTAQIRDAIDTINVQLQQEKSVFEVVEGPAGYKLAVVARYGEWVRLLRDDPRPERLRPAAMETLAIIAYRQPVTRADIEAIRGVSSDSALGKLLERELIYVSGRAELPGRPLQYATTEQFLEYCGIRTLEELPSSDVLSPNQITEWIRKASLPENQPSDSDVGLAQEPVQMEMEPEAPAEADNTETKP